MWNPKGKVGVLVSKVKLQNFQRRVVSDCFWVRRFSQVETTGTFGVYHHKRSDVVGSGLGLSISQELVVLMGSNILVSSSENGSKFYFALATSCSSLPQGKAMNLSRSLNEADFVSFVVPLAEREDEKEKDEIESENKKEEEKKKSILLVDDNNVNLMLGRKIISRIRPNANVEVASSGEEALAKCASVGFDLVLMDLFMPNMNGAEAAKALRSQNASILIVALSAIADVGDVSEDFNGFLAKPYTSAQMEALLQLYKC
jgi:CheY-like chemotaxis protein